VAIFRGDSRCRNWQKDQVTRSAEADCSPPACSTKLDARAGELARIADERGVAGTVCERYVEATGF